MKNFLTLVFVCISLLSFAQKGNFSIITTSTGYQLKLTQYPKPPHLVYFTHREVLWRVTCLTTGAYEETITPMNGVLNYKFNGNIQVNCRVIYKHNNVVQGQQHLPSKCIFGLNPSACFE